MAQSIRIVFIVDDNLIGNKMAMKIVLRDVIAWQEAKGYPIVFFTEASLNLAEDDELMQLMVDANIMSSLSVSRVRTRNRCARPRSIKTFAKIRDARSRPQTSKNRAWRFGAA